ncbi:hypothetical protein JXA32_14385, partial [Candidatus Sumerlaeota bacterium]|nr:hypothetical protein [Candidatus Sumerlaeota bacterium]
MCNLARAVEELLPMTREYIEEAIPDEHVFRVTPNQSRISSPCINPSIMTFPEDALPAGQSLGPWSAEQAVDFLWRKGKVPRWIHLFVEDVDQGRSVIQLRCSSHYVKDESLLYHPDSTSKCPPPRGGHVFFENTTAGVAKPS